MHAEAAAASDATGLDVTAHPTALRVFVVRADARVLGNVIQRGRSFRAVRQHGQTGRDIRRVGDGFRSLASAVRFVGKGDRSLVAPGR